MNRGYKAVGHAAIAAVRPPDVGCFVFDRTIRPGDTNVDRPDGTVKHTVEVCPAWVEHRRVLVEAIRDGDLSHPALVVAMVLGGPKVWEAVTSINEAVMQAKEVAEHERERLVSDSRLRRPW